MTCRSGSCPEPVHALGLCQTHYGKQLRLRNHRGDGDRVPVQPVLRHIDLLRARGWSWPRIATEAKSSTYLIGRMRTGELRQIRRDKAARYLAITPGWVPSELSVPLLGTQRRLDALGWLGWSGAAIARELGLSQFTFPRARERGVITARVAAAVADFYDTHSGRPGPSQAYAKRARTLGAVPPAAWDDDRLDDPAATPDTGQPTSTAIDLAEVEHLAAGGTHIDEIARRLGKTVQAIEKARERTAARTREDSAA